MESWNNVRWAEARQVLTLMGRKDPLPAPDVSPSAFFAEARQSGDLVTAVTFIGHALPRHEGVAWAAHAIDRQTRAAPLPAANRQLLDMVLRWADEPTDEHRRAAYDSREMAGEDSPEALLALAAFFSGGSIAPEELAPVLPAPELSGKLAASAVIVGAYRGTDSKAALNQALDMGDRVAAEGLEALTSQ